MSTSGISGFIESALAGGLKNFFLPALAALTVVLLIFNGNSGVTEVVPGEVAVVYNTLNGESRVVREQGTLTYMPFFEKVKILDLSPQILVMEGEGDTAMNQIKRLTVRAKDGSMFWFDRLEIHYQIIAGAADTVIERHGSGDAYKKNAVAVYAREVLRNEFGRYDFLEVVNPSSYGAATTASKRTLNSRLEPYGIMVTQITTPKPRFEQEIEGAINKRQEAEQEVEVQVDKRKRLEKQRDKLVQSISQKKNAEYQTLLANLEGKQKEAENRYKARKREADKYYIGQIAKCKAYKDRAIKKAEANKHAYRQQAEGVKANIEAVGNKGEDVLNFEIAKHIFPQLKKLKAVPYARAPNPVDIRHINAKRGAENR